MDSIAAKKSAIGVAHKAPSKPNKAGNKMSNGIANKICLDRVTIIPIFTLPIELKIL